MTLPTQLISILRFVNIESEHIICCVQINRHTTDTTVPTRFHRNVTNLSQITKFSNQNSHFYNNLRLFNASNQKSGQLHTILVYTTVRFSVSWSTLPITMIVRVTRELHCFTLTQDKQNITLKVQITWHTTPAIADVFNLFSCHTFYITTVLQQITMCAISVKCMESIFSKGDLDSKILCTLLQTFSTVILKNI